MISRIFLAVVGLFLASIALGEGVVIPPRPAPPARPEELDRRELSPQQRKAAQAHWQEARERWRADVKAWEAALTPEQRAALKQEEERVRNERREAAARERRLPVATDGYAWEMAAAQRKLAPAEIARLRTDKIAYGATVKQSFVPYLHGPVFITSDSLLNAFHVLFEDTFREYELRQVTELRQRLETVFRQARVNLEKSPFPAGETAPAWRQVQFAIGPALCLLGSPVDLFDEDVRAEIQTQVAKIREAKDLALPTWLEPVAPSFRSLDYRACQPIGFYAGEDKLADYFRAVRWLQLVPFRAERDVEVAAIGMLGYGVNQALRSGSAQYFAKYGVVLGETDTRGLPEAAYDFQNFFSVARGGTWADALREKKRWILPLVVTPDEQASLPRGQLPANAEALLARLEYRVLPAHRVWDSAVFQQLANRQLEPEGLAVAMLLGSDLARTHLQHLKPGQVQAAADAAKAGATSEPRGEPSLYEDYLNVLRTLTAPPPPEAPAFLRSAAWQAKSTQTLLSGWAQMRHTFTLQAKRSELYLGMTITPPGFVEPNPEFFAQMADLIERARGLFEANRAQWDDLASVTRKLEALAQKQLRQQPWSPTDETFLRDYGTRLAHVMGYAANSYLTPHDDAPRWADVHHTEQGNDTLAVGVGRPRILYVLYPWNGLEILCQGAVLPYYEYRSHQRLTDPEWKALLDSPAAPAQPTWLLPYVRN
ncbi:DUF3160 domain-containing protein [Opitutus sp. ER46]|uniref:DUF3160 domain-containing protein n=1 Tax=Opitutus sp. ER46 TaxID=2161864 RepID=UPI001E384898|nr:DUF3160 domain-containing protein [Opitutus sp. ER46]